MNDDVQATPKQGRPMLALILGILGLLFWIVPPLGLLVTIIGLVQGAKALKGEKRGMALAAVILCGIGLAATGVNIIVGAYMGATGKHTLVNRMMQK